MRSGISCFNSHLWCKNMTRFWPVWTCCGLFWMLALPLQFLVRAGRSDNPAAELAELARDVTDTLSLGAAFSFLFGICAAMAVFSYLFNSRSACMMHSLPLDRRALFVTNYLSGLSFLLLPNLAVSVLTLLVEAAYGCLNPGAVLTWLAVQSATALFFYSFAVFCAMFTGNTFALPAFYVILNFLCDAVYTLLTEVLSLLLYGSWGLGGGRIANAMDWLTPLVRLSEACGAYLREDGTELVRILNRPGDAAVYAAAGVVLAGLALAVYRRRQIESAGDVVAVAVVRPVFRYGVALCAGLAFGSYTSALLDLYEALPLSLFVILWAVIGYFVAEMLLQKSFRVWKRWKGAAVLACLLAVLFTAVELDWFGYETRVPAPEQVQSVRVLNLDGAPYDSAGQFAQLTDPRDIAQAVELHRAIVEQRNRDSRWRDNTMDVDFVYTLTDGSTLHRHYDAVPVWQDDLDTPGSAARAAQQLLDNRDYVRLLYRLDDYQGQRLVEASLERVWSEAAGYYDELTLDASSAQLNRLWQAVLRDFDEGNLGVRYLFDNSLERRANTYTADLCFLWAVEKESGLPRTQYAQSAGARAGLDLSRFCITLTPRAEHTLAVLEELGALDGVTLRTHLDEE